MTYTVTSPLVLAVDQGGHTHHVYQGGLIEWLSPEQEQHFLTEGLVVKTGTQAAAAATDDDEGEDDGSEVPKQAAPKAVWVDYAVNGAPEDKRISEEEAEAMTKAELQEAFG